ncbi:MAG: 2,3-bisphosphoglycerate-independent phosphoglycerate mutase [Firmicutes bacterium]|nr:2,3-bisphosphoglycerate-independent phosphoglycerate mutase [Bacillota bacterium]MDY5857550.1 2,3-bisphosphoglycerate-independent phosphoglycerate mutase [Anaerovoracaceae bacterium]
MKKPTMLMILDGFGLSDAADGNAIAAAKKPNLDRIFNTYPGTQLAASGLAVGLPEGQMGNSEVGHLNIGAGRIVYQELTKITKAIEDGIFFDNVPLNHACDHVLKTGGTLHLYGLLSDGGVHSHITHLFALLQLAKKRGVKKVFVHCFMDGRDVPPTSGADFMKQLEDFMDAEGIGRVGVVSGRYYAMDRDKRWERVSLAYDALTLGEGKQSASGSEAVAAAYARGETDEFILPTVCGAAGENAEACIGENAGETDFAVETDFAGKGYVHDGDSIVMFNFRPDRARELTRAFVDPAFDGFERKKTVNDLCYVCMTQYDAEMPNVEVAFPPRRLENTLGEYISGLGLHQLRIAETEKYAHVTFFFNGGVEEPNPLEDRILIPSPKVATYDLQPEMSAVTVTEKVLEEIAAGERNEASMYDLIILNFANADMVGHTGVFDAAVRAIETLDACVGRIEKAVLAAGGQILLTADHGNADEMLDEAGNVVTAHSTNPVPLVHIADQPVSGFREGGKLADIAPTLLHLMGLPVPPEMTGECLIEG